MVSQLRYFNVNWIDGMKLNKDHFVQLENVLLDRLKDSASLSINSYNYGLLPPSAEAEHFFEATFDSDRANQLRITITECRAVTSAGVRINISRSNKYLGSANAQSPQGEYNVSGTFGKTLFIMLAVNPFGKVPVGETNPGENPPRSPYTDFEYQLHIVPADEINTLESGSFHLTIGKMKISSSGVAEIVENFIPPCTAIASSPELLETHEQLRKVLSELERDAGEIIKKAWTKKHQNEVLVNSVRVVSEHVFDYLTTSITAMRWYGTEQPPIVMVEFMTTLARVVKNTIDVHTVNGKELMLNYFKDWVIEMRQGNFEDVLDSMVNHTYDHMDIAASITKMNVFRDMIATIFRKMSTLEFIGDKKETREFTVTRNEAEAKPIKKSGFLLGPQK